MKLAPNKPYNLSFESEITGVDTSNLKGFLRMSINGIEYGVPATIRKNSIDVSIPPFESFVKVSFEKELKVPVKLEIVSPEFCLCVWEDTFVVKPVVKARVAPVNIQGSGKVVVKGLKKTTDIDKQFERAGITDPRVKELIKKKMKK
ncbi:hypothetical protein J7J18_07050 [bacterium]|nr:hypothetical protein [bacterium]